VRFFNILRKAAKRMPSSGWSWPDGQKRMRFLDSASPKTPKSVTNFKSPKILYIPV